MQGEIFTYGLLAALAIALLVAAFTDLRRRQIDNWLNAGIAAGAPLFWLASGMGWMDVAWQLGIALATFAVLAVLFAIRAMGGGDVKLLTALALWIKPAWFLQLLVVMAIAGGVLTILFGCWHGGETGSPFPMASPLRARAFGSSPFGIFPQCLAPAS